MSKLLCVLSRIIIFWGFIIITIMALVTSTYLFVGKSQSIPVHAEAVNVGLVYYDSTGPADMSFNWMANEGLQRAVTELGVVATTYTPATPDDYGALLQQCVNDGNVLCLSVGFPMTDATWTTAQNNPGVDFAIVDVSWESYPGNLRGMVFAADQVGYLAGILAGLMTQSDVVGAVGGIPIPQVLAFTETFRYGAQCINPEAKAIINYTDTFSDPDLGATIAQAQISEGADVIFGAGGPTGTGAILSASQFGAWVIGVDTDQWHNDFGSGTVPGSDKLLSSAMKRVDTAVFETISDEVASAFTPGTKLYDLSVDGVGLAPYHETDSSIPTAVKDTVNLVKEGIINGAIDVWQRCGQPRVGLVYSDSTGPADLSFNWMANEGLQQAVTDFDVLGTTYAPTTPEDFGPLLQQCADEGNALCLSVGFGLTDATWNAAQDNPGVDFAIVDVSWESNPDNLRGIIFAADEVGYLAGTLAGLMTESGVVGAVGGIPIPPVQAFLETYRNAAECTYPGTRAIITYTDSFGDPAQGAAVAQSQISEGADVIFGAGGPTGNGAILSAAQSGVWAIGVDSDQWHTVFESGTVPGSDMLLSSAMKRVDNAVYASIADEIAGTFTSGTELYDLSVEGVGLAPNHEAESSIPQELKDTVNAVKQAIIDGEIDVWQACEWDMLYLPLVRR